MKRVLPCLACGIDTAQTVIEPGNRAICWCGFENEFIPAEPMTRRCPICGEIDNGWNDCPRCGSIVIRPRERAK